MQNYKGNALQLVSYTPEKGYWLHKRGLQFLQSLPTNRTYSILSIVGKSKTGKSFLLNQLYNKKVFDTSSYLQRCTKGIMIANDTIRLDGSDVIVLDTQGFGGIDSSDNIDYQIFMMAILLSSTMIYNSIGMIDEQTLNGLSMVIEVSKILQKQLLEDSLFGPPALFWLLRDFSLRMQDKNGQPISSNTYLQNALSEQKSLTDQASYKNRIRRTIKTIFPERCCQTLIVPGKDQNFQQEQVREQFADNMQYVKKKLFRFIQRNPKQLCKKPLQISNFISCLKLIIDALNAAPTNGKNLPAIENLSIKLIKNQVTNFKNNFKTNLNKQREKLIEILTSNQSQCHQIINQYYKDCLKNVRAISGNCEDHGITEIKDKFVQEISEIVRKNIEDFKLEVANQIELKQKCSQLCQIEDIKVLDDTYQLICKQLSDKNNEQIVMKLEITYLKQKVQILAIQRQNYEKLKLELINSKNQILSLKQQLVKAESCQNDGALAQRINDSKQNQHCFSDKKEHENQQQTMKKIKSGSFYVPYMIIENRQSLSIEITKTLIKEDTKFNTYIQYVLDINLNGFAWLVHRKYKDFTELFHILQLMFPKAEIPICKISLNKGANANQINRKEKIQQRRRELENYLRQLIGLQFIRNSRIFQKFIKLNKEYHSNL